MKFLVRFLGKRALKRWLKRRSPKADLVGGSAIAMAITAVMVALDVPAEAAAAIGANLGALGATVANLLWGDDPDNDEGVETP